MPGINDLMAIGKRALLANQIGMQVTSNNISNAQNPDYSREDPQFVSDHSVQVGNFFIGSGVRVESIRRMRDQFYDLQFYQENAKQSRYDTDVKYGKLVEGTFNDLSEGGIANLLDSFWNAWMDVANHPQDLSQRKSLRAKAEQLVNTFHQVDTNLRSIQNQAKKELQFSIKEVNRLIRQIVELNKKLSGQQTDHENSALMDQRDRYIKELSEYIPIQVTYQKDNTATVISAQNVIVDRTRGFEFKTISNNEDGFETISVTLYGDQAIQFESGKIKSLVDQIQTYIPETIKELDGIVRKFVEQVNELHSSYYDLEGETGINFFNVTGETAGSISLANEIKNSVAKIAVSKDGQRGDGSGAIDIARLKDSSVMHDGLATINEAYYSMVNQVGERQKYFENTLDNQKGVVKMLENQRQSIMGVSLEEEMVNLIKFQTAFGAASKVISSVDQMMETILQLV